jgi:predicted nucleic acid-binding protein
VRGADAVYIAAAFLLKIPLCTLDADQRERASNLVDVLDHLE